jgi:hypothetical protein
VSTFPSKPCTAFDGHHLIAAGPLLEVALAVKAALAADASRAMLTFDDATGSVIDLDLRGSPAEVAERLAERSEQPAASPQGRLPLSAGEDGEPARGRGRPKLGVVAREVTLLPRHWEWLSAQSGGASAALRRLVDEARRSDGGKSRVRVARETAYRFMSAMAGDLPGFEEAARGLFAGDRTRFVGATGAWPPDVRGYAVKLAAGAFAP